MSSSSTSGSGSSSSSTEGEDPIPATLRNYLEVGDLFLQKSGLLAMWCLLVRLRSGTLVLSVGQKIPLLRI